MSDSGNCAAPRGDYHVVVDGHYYSVPSAWRNPGRCVHHADAGVDLPARRAVASHPRSPAGRAHHAAEHMPPSHHAVVERTPERLRAEAAAIGVAGETYVDRLIDSRRHVGRVAGSLWRHPPVRPARRAALEKAWKGARGWRAVAAVRRRAGRRRPTRSCPMPLTAVPASTATCAGPAITEVPMLHQTIEKLHALELCAMADALLGQSRQPGIEALGFEERLALLVDVQHTAAYNAALGRAEGRQPPVRPRPWRTWTCARRAAGPDAGGDAGERSMDPDVTERSADREGGQDLHRLRPWASGGARRLSVLYRRLPGWTTWRSPGGGPAPIGLRRAGAHKVLIID